MPHDPEYLELAARAEWIGRQTSDGRFAASWRQIAEGLRRLAVLRAALGRCSETAQNEQQQRHERPH